MSICTLYTTTFEMSVAVTHYILRGPSFCYKIYDIANYMVLYESTIYCAFCPYSPKLVNKVTLSQKFSIPVLAPPALHILHVSLC